MLQLITKIVYTQKLELRRPDVAERPDFLDHGFDTWLPECLFLESSGLYQWPIGVLGLLVDVYSWNGY